MNNLNVLHRKKRGPRENLIEVALFPLPKVFLNPKGKLTLNIFEPRYLEMVQDCVLDDMYLAPAHALRSPGKNYIEIEHNQYPYLFPLFGYGKTKIIHKTDEGNLVTVTSGVGKGIVHEVYQEDTPYLKALIEPVEENLSVGLHHDFFLRRLRQLTEERVEDLLENPLEVDVLLNELRSPAQLVSFFNDHLVELWPVKFELFKTLDINERIELLGHYLTNNQNLTSSSNL